MPSPTTHPKLTSAFTKGVGQFGPKFHVEGASPTNHSLWLKKYMNFPFIRYKNVGRTFVCFVTIHRFDGQTDGHTGFAIRKTALHIIHVQLLALLKHRTHNISLQQSMEISKLKQLITRLNTTPLCYMAYSHALPTKVVSLVLSIPHT